MYKLEIETNNTVKRIQDPRKVKVINAFLTTLVKVMDGDGNWINVGHTFCYADARFAASLIEIAISRKKSFVEVNLN